MTWQIVTDSSNDQYPDTPETAAGQVAPLLSVPFVIRVGEKDYVDTPDLDIEAMIADMEACQTASSSACPSPQAWVEQFMKADNSIVLTISSNLSGSMESATLAKQLVQAEHPEKNIALLDSWATGPKLVLGVEIIRDLIAQGLSFEEVEKQGREAFDRIKTCFALCSFENLVKNGRMRKIEGFLAHMLGMWGIGVASPIGTIDIKGKTRGSAKALKMIVDIMGKNGYAGGKMCISHCMNAASAGTLKNLIQERWPGAVVDVIPTRGLCSFYAERGGLIISY